MIARVVATLLLLIPFLAWGQSSLPQCSSSTITSTWSNCFGMTDLVHGERYVGEFVNGKWHGTGAYTYMHGGQYVGEFRDGVFAGDGIVYDADGKVSRSGKWINGRLVQAAVLDIKRFPFDPFKGTTIAEGHKNATGATKQDTGLPGSNGLGTESRLKVSQIEGEQVSGSLLVEHGSQRTALPLPPGRWTIVFKSEHVSIERGSQVIGLRIWFEAVNDGGLEQFLSLDVWDATQTLPNSSDEVCPGPVSGAVLIGRWPFFRSSGSCYGLAITSDVFGNAGYNSDQDIKIRQRLATNGISVKRNSLRFLGMFYGAGTLKVHPNLRIYFAPWQTHFVQEYLAKLSTSSELSKTEIGLTAWFKTYAQALNDSIVNEKPRVAGDNSQHRLPLSGVELTRLLGSYFLPCAVKVVAENLTMGAASELDCVNTDNLYDGLRQVYVGEQKLVQGSEKAVPHGIGIRYAPAEEGKAVGRWQNGVLVENIPTAEALLSELYSSEGLKRISVGGGVSETQLRVQDSRPDKLERTDEKRLADERNLIDAKRVEDERKKLEQTQLAESKRIAEERHLAQAKEIVQENHVAEDFRVAGLKRAEEDRRGEGALQREYELAAAVEAERRKRQELEERLAAAEAKERERQQAQTPQRQEALVRNERRVALVVGNGAYKQSPLDNAVNDATDLNAALKTLGFQTILLQNASLQTMRQKTREFADLTIDADVALIFYSGHGIEYRGNNYLIPTSTGSLREFEVEDETFNVSRWMDMLETQKGANKQRVNIVILDACRDNAFSRGWRNTNRGLARMDAPSGTILAYSTSPGKVASDGNRGDRNSPYTKSLLRAIQQQNTPIEQVFKDVRRMVVEQTKGEQVPWENSSLIGNFVFKR